MEIRSPFRTLQRLAAGMGATAEEKHLAKIALDKLDVAYDTGGFHANPTHTDALKAIAQFFGDIAIDE